MLRPGSSTYFAPDMPSATSLRGAIDRNPTLQALRGRSGGREVNTAGRLAPLGFTDEQLRRAFDAIVDAKFTDVVRPFAPGPGVYTYWDYTQLRFPKRQGMRIDFILASPALTGRVTDAQIVREERKGKAPSDHAPVLIDVRPV